MNYYNDLSGRARKVGLDEVLPFDEITVHTQLVDGRAHYPGVRHHGTLDVVEPAVELTLTEAAQVTLCEYCRVAFSPSKAAVAAAVIIEAAEVTAKAERYLARPTRRPVADVLRDLAKQRPRLEAQVRQVGTELEPVIAHVVERIDAATRALSALPVAAQVLEAALAKVRTAEVAAYGNRYTYDTTPTVVGITRAARVGGDLGALLRALSGYHTLPEVLLLVVPAWVGTHIVRTSASPAFCHNAEAVDPRLAALPSLLEPGTARPHAKESLLADAEKLWGRHIGDAYHPFSDPVTVIKALIASTT